MRQKLDEYWRSIGSPKTGSLWDLYDGQHYRLEHDFTHAHFRRAYNRLGNKMKDFLHGSSTARRWRPLLAARPPRHVPYVDGGDGHQA